jgi:hypothetical protein
LSTRALKLDAGGIFGGPATCERLDAAGAAPAIAAAPATTSVPRGRIRLFMSVPSGKLHRSCTATPD